MVGVGWCWILARYKKLKRGMGGGGGGVLSASGLIQKKRGGGGGGGMIAYRGARDTVQFLRAGINRQRKCAAIFIKCGPKSYEFINGAGGGGGGGHVLMSL